MCGCGRGATPQLFIPNGAGAHHSFIQSNVEAMSKRNGPASVKTPKNRRRMSALGLLERQLVSGVKPVKKKIGETIPLVASDVQRIKREIERLKAKIVR